MNDFHTFEPLTKAMGVPFLWRAGLHDTCLSWLSKEIVCKNCRLWHRWNTWMRGNLCKSVQHLGTTSDNKYYLNKYFPFHLTQLRILRKKVIMPTLCCFYLDWVNQLENFKIRAEKVNKNIVTTNTALVSPGNNKLPNIHCNEYLELQATWTIRFMSAPALAIISVGGCCTNSGWASIK